MAEIIGYTRIHNHAIDWFDGNQLLNGSIYSLRPVELEVFQIYIQIKSTVRFINSCKSLASAFITFLRKINYSFYLWVNEQGLNTLTIKN